MIYRITKIDSLSGSEASIYTLVKEGETKTIFDSYIIENVSLFKSEIIDITARFRTIETKTGAREQYFKHHEGFPGDGVCALYDQPGSKLRLYCIRYGSTAIILGGGGEKPKNIRTLQENPKLKKENYLLREVSREILERIKSKELNWDPLSNDLIGNLEIELHGN